MSRARMHDDEVATSVALVERLVAEQFPGWSHLPVRPVDSYGTDHDIYRLGDDLCARLPIIEGATAQVDMDAEWLPKLAPHLPLRVPTQVGAGRPGAGYPFLWSVCTWLPGRNANAGFDDSGRAAADLAAFVRALRTIDTTGAPPRPYGRRGAPLSERDEAVREAIDALGGRIDAAATHRSWRESLGADPWDGPDVWIHGDLLAGNLLVVDGRLSAVIDFGTLGVGDPAADLLPAWNLFGGRSRSRFLDGLAVDEASRVRGRGWTLVQAVMALGYYWDTNPRMVTQASRALAEVLADRP